MITLNGATKSVRENSSTEASRRYPTPVVTNAPTKGANVACRSRPWVVIEFLFPERLTSAKEDGLPVNRAEKNCKGPGSKPRVQLLSKRICDVNVSSGKEYFCL